MPEPDRILRMATVLHRTGLSRATLYRKIEAGTFPRQLRISVHGCGWRESEINRWVADPETYRTTSHSSMAANSNAPQNATDSAPREQGRTRPDRGSVS